LSKNPVAIFLLSGGFVELAVAARKSEERSSTERAVVRRLENTNGFDDGSPTSHDCVDLTPLGVRRDA